MNNLALKEAKGTATILDLPNEILVEIFCKLSQEDILKNVALVSKRFLQVSRLHKTLPYIHFGYHRTYYALKLPKRIKLCCEFYPHSQIHISLHMWYSTFLKIRRSAPYISHMKMVLEFDCTRVPPKFKNLTYLELIEMPCSKDCKFEKIPKFWKKFPNLTYLSIEKVCDKEISKVTKYFLKGT